MRDVVLGKVKPTQYLPSLRDRIGPPGLGNLVLSELDYDAAHAVPRPQAVRPLNGTEPCADAPAIRTPTA